MPYHPLDIDNDGLIVENYSSLVKGINVDFSSHIPAVLAEERKRLQLSQAVAAEACGISREMWGKYERGLALPGAEVLARFVGMGADPIYILTGVREHPATNEEKALLDNYRHCTPDRQAAIRATSAALAEQALSKVKNKAV